MENLLWWGLTTLVSAFVGSYLAGYLKRKGENLATHEDIGKLVDRIHPGKCTIDGSLCLRIGYLESLPA
jgi:hypothetical protein